MVLSLIFRNTSESIVHHDEEGLPVAQQEENKKWKAGRRDRLNRR
jgi:hypothetical protein